VILLAAFLLQSAAVEPLVRLDRAVDAGIREGVFPGAVVMVGTRDTVLAARGYGHFTWQEDAPVPDPGATLFDVASLTKVVATTTAAALLVDAGALDLDAAVAAYVPGFQGDGKEAVTVRHLLEHRSGLRAFLPLHELTAAADEARARVLAEPLRWPPGARVEYSDLNAMLLGWVVEAAAGTSLDAHVREAVFAPLGMTATEFRPARARRPAIMPVGRWRGVPIAGEVHDQNAARLGGVSGHAGLYATGADLARFAQWWLAAGDRAPHVRPATVATFTAAVSGGRSLGWELRDTTTTDNTGRFLSARTYGHTGYTGTSLWIDPDRGLFVVLLTNRVYAPRTGRSISRLKVVRGAVADAAVALHAGCRAAGAC
jgi:CubicO group peptidase (beta-lactamase class C family)